MGSHSKPDATGWTDRLKDGRLRVQCEACALAGHRPQDSVRACETCRARSLQKAAEMLRFRELVVRDPAPAAAGDPAAGVT